MNKEPVKVKFPNESTWVEMVDFDWGEFKMDKDYDNEMFGWYLGTYVSILKNNKYE